MRVEKLAETLGDEGLSRARRAVQEHALDVTHAETADDVGGDHSRGEDAAEDGEKLSVEAADAESLEGSLGEDGAEVVLADGGFHLGGRLGHEIAVTRRADATVAVHGDAECRGLDDGGLGLGLLARGSGRGARASGADGSAERGGGGARLGRRGGAPGGDGVRVLAEFALRLLPGLDRALALELVLQRRLGVDATSRRHRSSVSRKDARSVHRRDRDGAARGGAERARASDECAERASRHRHRARGCGPAEGRPRAPTPSVGYVPTSS